MAEAKRGKAWVHRDGETRQVPPSQLPSMLAGGWSKGRPRKSRKTG